VLLREFRLPPQGLKDVRGVTHLLPVGQQLRAEELGALGLAVLLQPVGEGEAGRVVLQGVLARLQQFNQSGPVRR